MSKPLVFVALAGAGVGVYFLYRQQSGDGFDFGNIFDSIRSAVQVGSSQVQAAVTGNYLDIATSFIASKEGFSPKVYNDVGKSAIGYGHDLVDGDGFNQDSVIDSGQGWTLLRSDLGRFDQCISDYVKIGLSDNQRAAILSFVYNVGCGAFESSTMLDKINRGDFQGAANEFGRWNIAAGRVNDTLVSRRVDEMNLFLTA
jgi:lysozyme